MLGSGNIEIKAGDSNWYENAPDPTTGELVPILDSEGNPIQAHFRSGLEAEIPQEINNGSVYFAEDVNTIYADQNGIRTPYGENPYFRNVAGQLCIIWDGQSTDPQDIVDTDGMRF